MEGIKRKVIAIIIMLSVAFSLSAVYITAVAGDDDYIIDKCSGEVLTRVIE